MCRVEYRGSGGTYDVQVLEEGCFTAHRRRLTGTEDGSPRAISAIQACGAEAVVRAVETTPTEGLGRRRNQSRHEVFLAEPPYMGVSCPEPNSIACDRVGLSVKLREPAIRVVASIDGRRFGLDDPQWSGRRNDQRHRQRFAGFLQPAGLTDPGSPLKVEPENGTRWIGKEPVAATVELEVTYGDGDEAVREIKLRLHAGWG